MESALKKFTLLFVVMQFKDYFSNHASIYAQHRPSYPVALFEYLSHVATQRDTAWDCATGNGQVAVGLAPYFQHVYATDASDRQIAHAFPHPKVTYAVAAAERSLLPDQSIDLVTVGLALHWFNWDSFYAEVRRVLKPDGTIAVWGYTDVEFPFANPALCRSLAEFRQVIYPFFAPEIEHVWSRYQTIPFPFVELSPPAFTMAADWTVENAIGYIQTLSATQRFVEHEGVDRLNHLAQQFVAAWGTPSGVERVEWQIFLRVGKLA